MSKLVAFIATHPKLTLENRQMLFALVEKGADDLAGRWLREHGLLPQAVERGVRFREIPSAIQHYLTNEPSCLHTTITDKGDIGQLFLGAHPFSDACVPISAEVTPRMLDYVARFAFGVILNGFAVREIVTFDNGDVEAVCYGQGRSFLLRKGGIKE